MSKKVFIMTICFIKKITMWMSMKKMKRLTKITISFLIIVNFFISYNLSAEENNDIIYADITIEMDDGTNLSVYTELTVKKFSLEASGTTYTGEDIKNNIDGTETMGAIKYALRSILLDQIRGTFENAEVKPIDELPLYKNEKFHDNFQVNLTSNFFGINDSIKSHELVNGVLDLGAQVNYTFNLNAKIGWNNTYIIELGSSLDYIVFTNGKAENNDIEWNVFNWNGQNPTKEAILKIKKPNPTSNPKKEMISLSFELDTKEKQNNLETKIYLDSINIKNYSFLPSFITNLDYVSSDGIRLFIKNNMIDWDETIYEKTIKPIKNKIKTTVENTDFNQTLKLAFEYDKDTTTECSNPFEVHNMNAKPPIIGILKDEDIKIKIFDINSRALYGLINTGGTANISKEDINFGKNLNQIGYPYNITILLPKKVLFNKANKYTWNDTIHFKGIMESSNPPYYRNEEINSLIEMDIKNSDLNLLGFFTGEPEINLGVNIVETKNINITRLPDEFSLPEKITIGYLNSDALRLCIKENVFAEQNIDKFLNNIKKSFETRISSIITNLKLNGNINRDIFDDSIEEDVNISDMNKFPPIKTETYSDLIIPVEYSFSLLPPSFDIPSQKYTFKGVKNQSVTYKVYFPKGVQINLKSSLNKAEIKETEDNREYIEISFSPDEYNLTSEVSYKITISPLFLIGLFIPCIISLIIVLILIIVIFIINRKRKYKKRTPTHEQEEKSRYEDEDYYVPPPPGSK